MLSIVPTPDDAADWPEYTISGEVKAPRGWMFYLSAESDEFGPLTLTAIDDGGQSRVYHRSGYMPEPMGNAANLMGWTMFCTGAVVAMAVSWLLG